MFDGRWRQMVERGVAPVGSRLGARRLRPDHLTGVGVALAAAAAVVIGSGHLFIGLLLVIVSAVPDLFDGAVAKATGTASVRGAFFDSVADRVSDALILGGIAWYLAKVQSDHVALLPFAVLATSSLISYERAKAESLGLSARGGLMERAERVIALCFGLAFSSLLVPVLWVTLALTGVTAIQRFAKVWRQAPGPGAVTPARVDTGTTRAPTGVRRWREWRQASAARARRGEDSLAGWRARRASPATTGATRWARRSSHRWRLRDRTRP